MQFPHCVPHWQSHLIYLDQSQQFLSLFALSSLAPACRIDVLCLACQPRGDTVQTSNCSITVGEFDPFFGSKAVGLKIVGFVWTDLRRISQDHPEDEAAQDETRRTGQHELTVPMPIASGNIDTSERAQVLTAHGCDALQLLAMPCTPSFDTRLLIPEIRHRRQLPPTPMQTPAPTTNNSRKPEKPTS